MNQQSQTLHDATPIQLIPDELIAYEYTHTIKSAQAVQCCTYITQGMLKHKQKELIITLQQSALIKPGEPKGFLLNLIRNIFQLAKQGKLVDVGGYSSFVLTDDNRKIGLPFNMIYFHPIPLPGVLLPPLALTVRFMSPDEQKAYIAFGATRLMSSWAYHFKYFPYPPWSEIPAPNIASMEHFQASLLNKTPRMYAPWSTVNMEKDEIVLRLQPEASKILASGLSQFSPTQPMALLTNFDPRADACLAWLPEQNQTTMNITPRSTLSRVAGGFITFVPEQQKMAIRMFEDGFIALIPTGTWLRIREAMSSGHNITVPTAERTFRLEYA